MAATNQLQDFSVYLRDFFFPPKWRAAPLPSGEMGCTPSKSAVIYTQDKVCRDLDTCSTFVPSLKSSVSTPEKPRLSVETSSGRQTFLSGELSKTDRCTWYEMKLSTMLVRSLVVVFGVLDKPRSPCVDCFVSSWRMA